MKTQLNRICSGILLLSSLSFGTLLQAQPLVEILEQAQSNRQAEQALFNQRASEWASAPAAQQQTMLRDLRALGLTPPIVSRGAPAAALAAWDERVEQATSAVPPANPASTLPS